MTWLKILLLLFSGIVESLKYSVSIVLILMFNINFSQLYKQLTIV